MRENCHTPKNSIIKAAVVMIAAIFFIIMNPQVVAFAGNYTVSINQCVIQATDVLIQVEAGSIPASDDGMFHLIAQEVYEGGVTGTEIGSAEAAQRVDFVFPLNKDTSESRLYQKFVIAVVQNGTLVQASKARYITNPEGCSNHTQARNDNGKKGIMPAAVRLHSPDLSDLAVDQCTYNVPIGNLCNTTSGPVIEYTYNDKKYYFNSAIVGEYDSLVPQMNSRGIQLTLIILNNKTEDESLLHPLARNGVRSNYYAFNTTDKEGVERLEAIATFLANRYSGTGHGTVDNWIIGNELNCRADWHYLPDIGLSAVVTEYANSFRIFYSAIKSVNANARVYISLEQEWNAVRYPSRAYTSKSYLDKFNSIIKEEGDIYWDLAYHPYNMPMYSISPWSGGTTTTHSVNTSYISMNNIDVLTDYMCRDTFLSPNGEVRSILLSEQGYTSIYGEELQAAAIVYGYLQSMKNQHIDGFILARQMDDSSEMTVKLSLGIQDIYGNHKLGYDYYKYIDSANAQAYIDSAASIIGVSDMEPLFIYR
ncbi:MAG: hypothetical protein K6A23_00355 [Butyrivibrio sp.]|nr:hypothetical protein [Butyrivibrio sp.]